MIENDTNEDDYHIDIFNFINKKNIQHPSNRKNIKIEKSFENQNKSRKRQSVNNLKNETSSYLNQSSLNNSRVKNHLNSSSSFNRSIASGISIKPDLNDPFWAFNSQDTTNHSFLLKSSKNSKYNQSSNNTINSANSWYKPNTSFLIFDSNFINDSNNKTKFKKSSCHKDIDIEKLIKNIDKSSNNNNNNNNSKTKLSSKWESNQNLNRDDSFNSDSICSSLSSVEEDNNNSSGSLNIFSSNSKSTRPNKQKPNDLFDIVERENTDFSAKLNYDKTQDFSSLSPHTYLDLLMDPNLKLSRQNTFRLRGNNLKNNNITTTTPKLYNDLTQPTVMNLYSELNFNNRSNKSSRLIKSLSLKTKPKNNLSIKQLNKAPKTVSFNELLASSFDLVVYDEHTNNKILKNDYTESYIFNENTDPVILNADKINVSASSSLFNSGPLQSSTSYSSDLTPNVAIINQPTIFRINDSIKETPFVPKSETQKNNLNNNKSISQKNINTKNKIIVKEFKYCILTDLKIGEGEFSETFQGYRYDRGAPIKIAGKLLKNLKDNDDQTSLNFLSEISVLSKLGKHDHVIEYLGVNTFNNSMFMIFEYAEKGDLKRLLDTCRKNPKRDISITNLYKLKIGYEVASGMDYISSLDIVHKDLAARNILLDKDYNCKISDFGCCKSEFLNKRPIRWMAPESLNKLLFTTASDVWSFGVLLWEVYTLGMTPYPGMTDGEVIGRINQWYRLYKPHDCPNDVYSIMLSCWKDYHKARPRFSLIKNKFRDLHRTLSESSSQAHYN